MSRLTQQRANSSGDPEFDAYVASLIARESKAKELAYQTFGVGVYKATSTSSKPKPNTRFLNALIRNTDGHNQALLRQEAERDRERRRQRGGHSLKERAQKHLSQEETRRLHSCSRSLDKRKEIDEINEKILPPRNEAYTKRPKLSQEAGVPSSNSTNSSTSKMDKYFREDYDPRVDIEDFIMDRNSTIPEYTLFENTKTTSKKKKEKKKHKKGKKKKKSKDKDLDLSPKPETKSSVREWDMGKVDQSSWDPQLNPYMPTYEN